MTVDPASARTAAIEALGGVEKARETLRAIRIDLQSPAVTHLCTLASLALDTPPVGGPRRPRWVGGAEEQVGFRVVTGHDLEKQTAVAKYDGGDHTISLYSDGWAVTNGYWGSDLGILVVEQV